MEFHKVLSVGNRKDKKILILNRNDELFLFWISK